jgi:hypothetical protein
MATFRREEALLAHGPTQMQQRNGRILPFLVQDSLAAGGL